MEEEGNGRKAMDLAAEWKENGWTHVESAGCHGGLLSEGHRQYMKPTKLNEIFGANKGSGNGNKLSECEFQETRIQVFGTNDATFKASKVHENVKSAEHFYNKTVYDHLFVCGQQLSDHV